MQQAKRYRNGKGQCCRGGEEQFLGEIEFVQDASGHDMNHPFLEIGAGDARDTGQRRPQTEFTDFQNAFGIDLAVATEFHDFFIASALALVKQARSEPPDQGIEPEHGLYDHVKRGEEIVAAKYVQHFVGENGFEMGVVDVNGDSFGPEENGAGNTENSGLEGGSRQEQWDGPLYACEAFDPAQGSDFASFRERHGRIHGGRNPAPADCPYD